MKHKIIKSFCCIRHLILYTKKRPIIFLDLILLPFFMAIFQA